MVVCTTSRFSRRVPMCEQVPKVSVRQYRFAGGQEEEDPLNAELVILIPEIGAGVSLPGIVAAKCGAEIILSDNAELPECLDNCRRSCQMNNLSGMNVVGLTWGQMSPSLLDLPPVDIILASDVFFEPEDFEDVISIVYYLMEKKRRVQFWTTYQVRSADWSIEGLLYKWDMESTSVPLQSFDANKEQLAGSSLPGRHTIEMVIITHKATKLNSGTVLRKDSISCVLK
ncbi:histone-arginine methyltransferase METTL23 isoform X2 [Hemicordylus capensis]|uniref:histone-arginine methyltransferase METTL23 isoform X2 n=1 Tax=Hemicordylus capensis TaxID=884348 RepID=UPI002304808E|nr:histone-arginine methyltransferase METTL23 isoform X2 [Hemicordylus capensis]